MRNRHNLDLRFGIIGLLAIMLIAGCGQDRNDRGFFTSGSRDADQRADQRMAKAEQLRDSADTSADKAKQQDTLYARLGGEKGLQLIVDDFVPRAMADPRVNWDRRGVIHGGFNFHHGQSMEWHPTTQATDMLRQHMVQFLAVATGGPSKYAGREIKATHANMHISNAEFDAVVGDLKASLDKLQVPDKDQKELLSIVESTRSQIVEER